MILYISYIQVTQAGIYSKCKKQKYILSAIRFHAYAWVCTSTNRYDTSAVLHLPNREESSLRLSYVMHERFSREYTQWEVFQFGFQFYKHLSFRKQHSYVIKKNCIKINSNQLLEHENVWWQVSIFALHLFWPPWRQVICFSFFLFAICSHYKFIAVVTTILCPCLTNVMNNEN